MLLLDDYPFLDVVWTMLVLATELPGFQSGLLTMSLTGHEWLACVGLAALLPLVIETSKFLRRRAAPEISTLDARRAVTPGRAVDGHDPASD